MPLSLSSIFLLILLAVIYLSKNSSFQRLQIVHISLGRFTPSGGRFEMGCRTGVPHFFALFPVRIQWASNHLMGKEFFLRKTRNINPLGVRNFTTPFCLRIWFNSKLPHTFMQRESNPSLCQVQNGVGR